MYTAGLISWLLSCYAHTRATTPTAAFVIAAVADDDDDADDADAAFCGRLVCAPPPYGKKSTSGGGEDRQHSCVWSLCLWGENGKEGYGVYGIGCGGGKARACVLRKWVLGGWGGRRKEGRRCVDLGFAIGSWEFERAGGKR